MVKEVDCGKGKEVERTFEDEHGRQAVVVISYLPPKPSVPKHP